MVKLIEGDFSARTARMTIVAARFNEFIVEGLLSGAIDTLKRHGVEDNQITVVRVPGAFEMPLAAKKIAQKGEADAIIAVGAVIRGATPHFDYVAGKCADGLAAVSLEFGIPVAFAVLTTDTIEQAIERAGSKGGNKGADGALTALEMVGLIRKLED